MSDLYEVVKMREMGKNYFFNHKDDPEKREKGLRLLLDAVKENDPEACYLVARLLLDGVLSVPGDTIERALSLMCCSANNGYVQARTFLNSYCKTRYQRFRRLKSWLRPRHNVLLDFDGEPIRVSCRGLQTPVDVVLSFEHGQAVLTISVNVRFFGDEHLPQPHCFRAAVMEGIRAWQGEYTVFNGQPVTVRVHATETQSMQDCLPVLPVTDRMEVFMQNFGNVLFGEGMRDAVKQAVASKRSFTSSGNRGWTVTSRKVVCIQTTDGRFLDFDEMYHVSKHEFGHVLGLGDLYADEGCALVGVEGGTFPELDSYVITDRYYNLVMCDHHGPISNNDVEMLILAFRENRMQLYQPDRLRAPLSAALGRGD